MKNLIILLPALFLFQSLAFASNLLLEIGELRHLQNHSSRIWVEKGSILQVQAKGSKLAIIGKKIGTTRLRIGDELLQVQVLDPSQLELLKHLKSRTRRLPGLRAEASEAEVEIQGYLHSWETWKSLLEDSSYSANFRMRARLPTDLKSNLQNLIDQDLKNLGLLSINVNFEPHLHVRLNPEQQSLDLYESYFRKLGIPTLKMKDSLTMEPIVRVDITVIEVSKSSSLQLGLQWPEQLKFDVLPSKIINSENLQATLNALENRGEAKTLASPNIICRSGKEAEFFAGGELPIKILNFKVQDIIWKKYGILLKIKPLADSSGKMSLSLETEVSKLAEFYDGIPSIETNKVSSHFDISKSQVIALSGLLREQNLNEEKGLPFLTRLPILGRLFSSQNYRDKKTELIILVKPTLMNSVSPPRHMEAQSVNP